MGQRVEVITGKERRRRWSEEEKARLVAESWEPGAVVAHVARRHGVAESCLYTWRKQIAGVRAPARAPELPPMIPVAIEEPEPAPPVPERSSAARAVTVLADGTRLEIDAGYPAEALRTLIATLRPRR